MRFSPLAALLPLLAVLSACVVLDSQRVSGSYSSDGVEVEYQLARSGDCVRIQRLEIDIARDTPIESYEIVIEVDGKRTSRDEVGVHDGVYGELKARWRNVEIASGSDVNLKVLGHPSDGSSAVVWVDASISGSRE